MRWPAGRLRFGQNSESQSSSTQRHELHGQQCESFRQQRRSPVTAAQVPQHLSETSYKKHRYLVDRSSREPEEIITATEPLKQMLTDELADAGL